MPRKLGHFAAAGASVLAGAALLLGYFSDILPLASTEPPSIWRFDLAVLASAAPWIAGTLVAIVAVSAAALVWRAARAR